MYINRMIGSGMIRCYMRGLKNCSPLRTSPFKTFSYHCKEYLVVGFEILAELVPDILVDSGMWSTLFLSQALCSFFVPPDAVDTTLYIPGKRTPIELMFQPQKTFDLHELRDGVVSESLAVNYEYLTAAEVLEPLPEMNVIDARAQLLGSFI